ncbi:toxin-antitoxin system HicB family antitoxin [Modestobacter sp. NPDC049651]|uniref:toxin-antitoxin system HicB family antitoxin n=1 Tax=unclassified Modestobacter TaxID=2643866 RepID=UPI00340D430A
MDLSEYVEALRSHLTTAAAAGTEQTRETARLLADTLEPAVRLTVTDALSAAAAEVTAALDGTVVDIRFRGRDPEVVVTPVPHTEPDDPPAAGPEPEPAADDGTVARISLRLPEHLKTRAEAAAADAGVSLNAWLVRAVDAGLRAPADPPRSGRGPRRYSGFARS